MSGVAPGRPPKAFRTLLRAPAAVYRWRLGFLLGRRFVLVEHIGRRTGRRYRTVLEVVGRDGSRWYVMSGFGRSADWYRNVTHAGAAELTAGRHRFAVTVREAPTAEATAVLAAYERRNRLVGPLFRWVLSRLVGWRYRGTPNDREQLVSQLPIVEMTRRAN